MNIKTTSLSLLCAAGTLLLAACGGGGSTALAPTEAVGKLTAASVPCVAPEYQEKTKGGESVTRIWCNLSESDTSGYELYVFDTADSLDRYLAGECPTADDPNDYSMGYMEEEKWAFGANWYTTRADSAVTNEQIANALGGGSTIVERCES